MSTADETIVVVFAPDGRECAVVVNKRLDVDQYVENITASLMRERDVHTFRVRIDGSDTHNEVAVKVARKLKSWIAAR